MKSNKRAEGGTMNGERRCLFFTILEAASYQVQEQLRREGFTEAEIHEGMRLATTLRTYEAPAAPAELDPISIRIAHRRRTAANVVPFPREG